MRPRTEFTRIEVQIPFDALAEVSHSHQSQEGASRLCALRLTLLPGACEALSRQVKPYVRRDLLAVGARGVEFAGWLYRDARRADLTIHWCDPAVEWAQEASDWPMQGYVLLKKSQAAWDERDGLRMLTLAQAAQTGPWPTRLPAA